MPVGADARHRYKKLTANLHGISRFFVEAFLIQHHAPPNASCWISTPRTIRFTATSWVASSTAITAGPACCALLFCGDHPMLALLHPANIDVAMLCETSDADRSADWRDVALRGARDSRRQRLLAGRAHAVVRSAWRGLCGWPSEKPSFAGGIGERAV